MTSKPHKRPPLTLMEYLFLLPGILAISPLAVALRLSKGFNDQDSLIFLFRLLCLSYLLMFCAVILYCWRPSMRMRNPYIHNVTIVTCLGMMSVLPIVTASLIIKDAALSGVVLFTSLEFALAALVLVVCAALNLACLVYTFKYPQRRPWFGRWEIFSSFILFTLVLFLVRFV